MKKLGFFPGIAALALVSLLLAAVLLAWRSETGGSAAPAATAPERAVLVAGGGRFVVEVVRDIEAQRKGLQGRDRLPEDGGMLFVYPESAPRAFWMENTRVPLVLAYLAADGTIQELHDLTPMSRTPVPSRLPARLVLELSRGAFAKAGARPGDRVFHDTGAEIQPGQALPLPELSRPAAHASARTPLP